MSKEIEKRIIRTIRYTWVRNNWVDKTLHNKTLEIQWEQERERERGKKNSYNYFIKTKRKKKYHRSTTDKR